MPFSFTLCENNLTLFYDLNRHTSPVHKKKMAMRSEARAEAEVEEESFGPQPLSRLEVGVGAFMPILIYLGTVLVCLADID